MSVKYMSAQEAVKLIKSGHYVYVQGSTSVPEVLMQAMADRGNELRCVTVYTVFAVTKGIAPICKP